MDNVMKTEIDRGFRSFLTFLLSIFLVVLFVNSALFAQVAPDSNSNSDQPSSDVVVEPTPIPIIDVVTEAEKISKRLGDIIEAIDKSSAVSVIESELPKLKTQLDSRTSVTSKLLESRPSLEAVRTSEQEWINLGKNVPAWKEDIKKEIAVYDNYVKELQDLSSLWQKTLKSLTQPGTDASADSTPVASQTSSAPMDVPDAVLEKIRSELDEIEKTKKQVESKRSDLLSLQALIITEESKIDQTLSAIKDVREEALSGLFVRDSPSIWSIHRNTDSFSSLSQEAAESISERFSALSDYASKNSDRFILHGVIFSLFILLFYWLRKRTSSWVSKEPRLESAFTVFKLPFVSALVLSIVISGWFYPQAPRVLSSILGALALVPGVIFLRQILERPFFPILNALMIFYFVDRLRDLVSGLPFLSRVLFIIELIGIVAFLMWFLSSKALSQKTPVSHHKVFNVIKKAIPVGLILFSIALAANIFGFVSLSNVVGGGVLKSSYIALILYAAVQIVERLMVFAFLARPLSSLRMINEHGDFIQRKAFRVIQWLAIVSWGLLTLNLFSIRETIYEFIKTYLTAELAVGSIAISLSDIAIFAFTVWLAFALSRLVRFVLEEDVYPRVNLAGGVPYAISTMLHYTLLVLGFLIAVAALGVDLSKFTILAGAFGVGLGFGMQNIVNNFVSGLILLFERPVKVDDVVQIGTHQGELKRIGLRASVLRTLEGSEVIVPNGQLISEEVTNWTFSDPQRRLEIDVGVAYGTDPHEVIELLTKVGSENEDVLKEPAPRTIFVGFGDSSLDFQLRAWTVKADQWVVVRSDLTLAIHDALKQANIEIPFPQRDLHVKGIPPVVLENFEKE